MSYRSYLLPSFILLLNRLTLVSAGSNAASEAWLAENSKKEGVTTLPSGLQYKVVTKGAGDSHPTADSSCLCHYHGTLTDGTVFDSSYDRGDPTSFAPNQVIAGWTESMQMMVEGDKWELYIPSDLAYGDRGSPPKIKGGDALIFTIEIIKINGAKVPSVVCDVVTKKDCSPEELTFLGKIMKKYGNDRDHLEDEIERVNRVAAKNTGASKKNQDWGKHRVRLLEQLLDIAIKEEL